MSRMCRLFLTVSLAVFALIAVPKVANASDYFCSIEFEPTSNSYGSAGYIYATVYTGPGCTGTYVAGGYLCSNGATDPNCASYEYHDLLALFTIMHDAELANQKIFYYTVTNYLFSGFEYMSPGYPY